MSNRISKLVTLHFLHGQFQRMQLLAPLIVYLSTQVRLNSVSAKTVVLVCHIQKGKVMYRETLIHNAAQLQTGN